MSRIARLLLLLESVDPAIAFRDSLLAYSPVAFYDASLSPLWQEDTRTTPATADATAIGAWDDLSGNGYHITQATAANRPLLKLAIKNGLPVLRFDGSNDFLANAAFPDFGDVYSAYAVFVYAAGGSGDATQGVFDVSTGALNTGFAMYHEATAKANARAAGGPVAADSTADLRDGTWRIHDMTNTGSQLQYRRNNGTAQTAAYTAPNPNTLSRLDVGKFGQQATYILNGDIAALLIFNSNHDSTTRAAIINILNQRYAVY